MRRASYLLALLIAVAAGASLFQLSYRSFRAQELAQAEGRLSLYESTVRAELERFSHLAYVMANDPFVIATAAGAGTGALEPAASGFCPAGRCGCNLSDGRQGADDCGLEPS